MALAIRTGTRVCRDGTPRRERRQLDCGSAGAEVVGIGPDHNLGLVRAYHAHRSELPKPVRGRDN